MNDDLTLYNRIIGNTSNPQTQLYNAIGRNTGASSDNFFTKRAKSIGNAVGTTLSAPISLAHDIGENMATQKFLGDSKSRMNEVAKKYGYNSYHDVWDARDKAEAEGDQATLDFINNTINPELQAQANANAEEATAKAKGYEDYRKNNLVSKNISQDNAKFLGSAINTLSTAVDLTGLGANPLANAIQGGIEGIADELEQNGGTIDITNIPERGVQAKNWDNFSVERAGQNALIGATTGAVTGALNKGINKMIDPVTGNLFKGGNALTRGLNKLGSETALGRVGSTLATGAARGAVSGAVGGATGAGLSAALNNQDVVASALQGAAQGAQQGAFTGATMAGANMALNRTPLMRQINQANEDWRKSGKNFDERLTNTLTSGDSAVGDWLMNRRQSRLLGTVGNIGNRIQDVSDTYRTVDPLGNRREYTPDQVRQLIDEYENYKAPEVLSGNSTDEVADAMGEAGVTLSEIFRNRNGGQFDPYSRADGEAFNKWVQQTKADLDTPTTARGWLNKAGERIIEDANDRGVGLSIKDVNADQDYVDTLNSRNTGGQWDTLAQESGYRTYDDAIRAFTKANPNAEVTAGSVLNWLDNNPGEWNPNMRQTMTAEQEVPELAYGQSSLGSNKKTMREKIGQALERSQVNATRKEMRDIGVENAGELVDNVRRRTGLVDIDEQAQFAREITGGRNSLLDTIQNDALSVDENGNTRMIDLTDLDSQIRKIVDNAPDTLVSANQKQEILEGIQRELTNPGVTAVQKANDMRASASELYIKNARTPNKSDVAEGNIYSQVAGLVEDKVYNIIPKEKVDWMYDTAIAECNGRAQQLAASGNQAGARAYTNLANDLASSERSIKNFRSLKKDFVDISKLATKTSQGNTAWNNSGLTVGTAVTAAALSANPLMAIPAAAAAKLLAPAIGESTTKAAAKLGGKLSDWGRNSRDNVKPMSNTQTTPVSNTTYNPSTQVYNAIGRTEGNIQGAEARTANYLTQANQEAQNPTTLESLASPSSATTSTSLYNSLSSTPTSATTASGIQQTGDYWTDLLGRALQLAMDNNDVTAFGQLYEMYQDALSKSSSSGSNISSWSSSDRSKLVSAQNALDQIDQLEAAYNEATGDQGGNVLQGNLRSLAANISGGNLDASAANYNSLAESVGMGIIKNLINLGVTEADAERYKKYLPALTDTKDQAAMKLETLRQIYQSQINNLYSANGM